MSVDKTIQVTGICNALVDIFADITEEQFAALGFDKGTMRLVEASEQKEILSKLGGKDNALCSGGSVANSLIAVAQLGGKSAMICCLGQDEYGNFFKEECTAMGITIPSSFISDVHTGTCLSLITPDAERTMRTCLGAAIKVGPQHVDVQTIAASSWLFIEGYVFSNGDEGRNGIKEAIRVAKESGTKIAITCSESWVLQAFGDPFREALEHAHLIFANEEEAATLAGTKDVIEAGKVLSQKFPHVVLTAGARGAYIWWEGEELHVPAYPCEPRDLTGAGDMFAGAFLYGITNGYKPADAAKRACFLAKDVITQVGARLKGDVRARWQQA